MVALNPEIFLDHGGAKGPLAKFAQSDGIDPSLDDFSLDPAFVGSIRPYLAKPPEQLGLFDKINLGTTARNYLSSLPKGQASRLVKTLTGSPEQATQFLQSQGLSPQEASNAAALLHQFRSYIPAPPETGSTSTALPARSPIPTPSSSISAPIFRDELSADLPTVSRPPVQSAEKVPQLGLLDKIRGIREAQAMLQQLPPDLLHGLAAVLPSNPALFRAFTETLGFNEDALKRLGAHDPAVFARHLANMVHHPGGLAIQALMNHVGLGPWWTQLNPGTKWGLLTAAGPVLLGLLASLFGQSKLGLGLALGGIGAGLLGYLAGRQPSNASALPPALASAEADLRGAQLRSQFQNPSTPMPPVK